MAAPTSPALYGDKDAHVGTARALADGGFAITERPLVGIADTDADTSASPSGTWTPTGRPT